MEHNLNVIDKAAMAISGALMLLGIVVLGIVEVVAGPPYGASPLTNEAGDIVATPMIDPNVRTGLVIVGLVVLAVYGVYKMASPQVELETEQAEVTAD